MPESRTGQLAMAQNRMSVMTPEKLTAWGIPTAESNQFGTLLFTARDALQKAQSDTGRTVVVTATDRSGSNQAGPFCPPFSAIVP
jgi:hypothetical protein